LRAAAGGEVSGGQDDTRGGTARAFPWDAVIHVGLCLLRLPPKDFWALTPVEFFAVAGGARTREAVMARDGLEALMRAFPDG
jgi:uncharacterized phage protein (TIGR02216 family)